MKHKLLLVVKSASERSISILHRLKRYLRKFTVEIHKCYLRNY